MTRGALAVLAVAGAVGAAAPAHAEQDYGLVMRPYAGYTSDAVEVSSTTPCRHSTQARIVVWPTDGTGAGTDVTTKVGADGQWSYRGTFWAPVTGDDRYYLVVNCLNDDGDGTATYEPGWTFTVRDGRYWRDGTTPPPPKPKPVPTTAPPVIMQAPTPVRERATPSLSPSPTVARATTPPAQSATPSESPDPGEAPREPSETPGTVTLVATDSGDGMGGWVTGGVAGAGATGLAATVLVRRRRRYAS